MILGLPRSNGQQEVASEVFYQFLERELKLDGARNTEFQRLHRIGKKKTGASRPIIARFLRSPNRERIFKRALNNIINNNNNNYNQLQKIVRKLQTCHRRTFSPPFPVSMLPI